MLNYIKKKKKQFYCTKSTKILVGIRHIECLVIVPKHPAVQRIHFNISLYTRAGTLSFYIFLLYI